MPELLVYSLSIIFLLASIVGLVWAMRLRTQLALAHQELLQTQQQADSLRAEQAAVVHKYSALQAEQQHLVSRAAVLEEQISARQSQLTDANSQLVLLREKGDKQAHQLTQLAQELAAAKAAEQERQAQQRLQQEQWHSQKVQLQQEFENLANKIFREKGEQFARTSQEHLGLLLSPFREQISEFRQRVDAIHQETFAANSGLHVQIQQLQMLNQQITQDAQNLTLALKGDKKLSGSWGEMQLEKTLQLAGLVPGEHYSREVVLQHEDGASRRPDFIIHLPDGKHLVLDSKVSLVDYDAACAASSEDDIKLALEAYVKALKRHIDGLAERDYSNLVGVRSPSFVLMFLPLEAAYIEALKFNRELFNYGYNKNVILVAHTTLMPILRTVANVWQLDRSSKEAEAISARAGDIYNQACLVAERLLKLGKTLSTANAHYNETVRALAGNQGLHGKLERFKDVAGNIT
ncbi:MAG TPA: DNA recombination protein RmuC, partial [Cellvibrionaceae bacterium]|nr:DNA recombination protein RmuC [Cellvibrionaceae bacterium]